MSTPANPIVTSDIRGINEGGTSPIWVDRWGGDKPPAVPGTSPGGGTPDPAEQVKAMTQRIVQALAQASQRKQFAGQPAPSPVPGQVDPAQARSIGMNTANPHAWGAQRFMAGVQGMIQNAVAKKKESELLKAEGDWTYLQSSLNELYAAEASKDPQAIQQAQAKVDVVMSDPKKLKNMAKALNQDWLNPEKTTVYGEALKKVNAKTQQTDAQKQQAATGIKALFQKLIQRQQQPQLSPEQRQAMAREVQDKAPTTTGAPDPVLQRKVQETIMEQAMKDEETKKLVDQAKKAHPDWTEGEIFDHVIAPRAGIVSKAAVKIATGNPIKGPDGKWYKNELDAQGNVVGKVEVGAPTTATKQPSDPLYQITKQLNPGLDPSSPEFAQKWETLRMKEKTDPGVERMKLLLQRSFHPFNDAQGNTIGWVNPVTKQVTMGEDIPGLQETLQASGGVIPPKPPGQVIGMAVAAGTMLQHMPTIYDELEKAQDKLGVGAGRWNEFMTGKVGASDPLFTKLRTDISLLQTRLMQAHVGLSGSDKMMEHFANLINQGYQSPENMRAALETIESYLSTYRGMAPTATGGAPKDKPKSGFKPF